MENGPFSTENGPFCLNRKDAVQRLNDVVRPVGNVLGNGVFNAKISGGQYENAYSPVTYVRNEDDIFVGRAGGKIRVNHYY